MDNVYQPPSQIDIQRVAEYWRRVELLACAHATELVFDSSTSGARCANCNETLIFMSQIQIDDMMARNRSNIRGEVTRW